MNAARIAAGVLTTTALIGMLAGCIAMNGLKPVTPGHPDGAMNFSTTIDAADPVLRWQAFPRPEDQKAFGPDMPTRITRITYELRLWTPSKARDWSDAPTTVRGLTKPEYRLNGLEYGQTYRWAARACFDLDKKPRVTQWTSLGRIPVWDSAIDHPALMLTDRKQ